MNIGSISPQQITGGADMRAAKGQANRQKLPLSDLSGAIAAGRRENGIGDTDRRTKPTA